MMRIAAGILLLTGACASSTEPDLGGMPIHTVRIVGELAFTARHELRTDTVRWPSSASCPESSAESPGIKAACAQRP